MFQKNGEQPVFRTAQVHHHPAGRNEMPGRDIQRPAAEVIGFFRATGFGRNIGHPAGTTQHGAYACQKLTRLERLDHIVVGAELQPHHAVGGIAESGKEYHGNGGKPLRGAQPAAQGKPVFSGHHDVENDKIGLLLL